MTAATRTDRGSTDTTAIYSEGADLVFERIFDAPRDQVWRAFTDPTVIPRWWGPNETATRVEALDVRPGGRWRFVSSAPDRDDVAFYGEFLEVDPPKRFKWTFMFDVEGIGPQGGPETHAFEELGGQTRVVSRGHFPSVEVLEAAVATGMIKGGLESWDRLEAFLAGG